MSSVKRPYHDPFQHHRYGLGERKNDLSTKRTRTDEAVEEFDNGGGQAPRPLAPLRNRRITPFITGWQDTEHDFNGYMQGFSTPTQNVTQLPMSLDGSQNSRLSREWSIVDHESWEDIGSNTYSASRFAESPTPNSSFAYAPSVQDSANQQHQSSGCIVGCTGGVEAVPKIIVEGPNYDLQPALSNQLGEFLMPLSFNPRPHCGK